ncbi:hypothetical protein KIPB_008265, partial [Kipferlia bialata]
VPKSSVDEALLVEDSHDLDDHRDLQLEMANIDRSQGVRVALKRISLFPGPRDRVRTSAREELAALMDCNHTNIVPVLDSFESADSQFIGSLLDHLHSKGYVHRDVKPANVLVTHGDHLYLTDFGLVRPSTDVVTPNAVTRAYRAPELLLGCPRTTPAADVYAGGAVAYELLTGRVLAGCGSDIEQILNLHSIVGPFSTLVWPDIEVMCPDFDKIHLPHVEGLQRGVKASLAKYNVPEEAVSIVLETLHPDPTQRPSASAVSEAWLSLAKKIRAVQTYK